MGARLEIERQVPDNLVDFGIARFGVLDNVAESVPVDDHGETAGVIVQPPERDTAPDVGALLKQLAQRRIQINRAIFYERGEGESGQGLGGDFIVDTFVGGSVFIVPGANDQGVPVNGKVLLGQFTTSGVRDYEFVPLTHSLVCLDLRVQKHIFTYGQ